MISEYKLTEEFFRGYNFRVLRITVPLMLVAVTGGWYVAGGLADPFVVVTFAVILGIILPLSMRRTLKHQQASFRSFRIKLDDESIVREQDGLLRLGIKFREIVSIHEIPGNGLVIKGTNQQQTLALPATLDRFEKLRAHLSAITPIVHQRPKSRLPMLITSSLGTVLFMVAFYRSESFPVVMVSGSILIVVLTACGIQIYRSVHIDRRVKRSVWSLILVVLSVAGKMWFMLQRR